MSSTDIDGFRENMLEWYDRHRRILPWRAPQGKIPDPYHVWLSEIMLQQTVVAAVIPYFTKFVDKWPTVRDLAKAEQEEVMKEWAGLGYYSRARNLHKCAVMVVALYDGKFPDNEKELKKLPGIGDYTAAAIISIAFNQPSVVVDGNVERVMARYFAITERMPDAKKPIKRAAAILAKERTDSPADYAQALMDLGATVCTPKSPKCGFCPISGECAAKADGVAEELPRKAEKKAKPLRKGYVYWVGDGTNRILTVRRPEQGMLAGMKALPTTEWNASKDDFEHPEYIEKLIKTDEISANRRISFIRHSFTHFDLELEIIGLETTRQENLFNNNDFEWIHKENIKDSGLPSLFMKVVNLMIM